MIKKYFELSKKEFNGIVVLFVILISLAFVPEIYSLFREDERVDYSQFNKELDQVLAQQAEPGKRTGYSVSSGRTNRKPQYFRFNPNDLPEEMWFKLGLSEKQVKVIKNYEAKGGKFYKPEDLQKIYSITSGDYLRLKPYIAIPSGQFTKYSKPERGGRSRQKAREELIVEINTADSAQLESLRGIGPAFAARILKYRKRIGGFVNKAQLLEVYGMDSARYQALEKQIEVDPASVSRIDISKAGFEELRRFPYLSYKQINAIIQYRKQHGPYRSVADLRNILILTEDIISRIEPYLIF